MAVVEGPLEGFSSCTEKGHEIIAATTAFDVHMSGAEASGLGLFDFAFRVGLVPRPGDSFSPTSANLIVVARRAEMIRVQPGGSGIDNATIRVYVDYEIQRAEGSGAAFIPLRGGSSVYQDSTGVDKNNATLAIEYNDQKRKVEAQVLVPRHNTQRILSEKTNTPDKIVHAYIGHVNVADWNDGKPKTWLIMNVSYELEDTNAQGVEGERKYRFEYEIEYNPTGWHYTEFWKDAEGNIPEDVSNPNLSPEIPNGVLVFEWHEPADFKKFGT